MRALRQALLLGAIIAPGLGGALDAAERMPLELQGVWATDAAGACEMPRPSEVAEFPDLIVTSAGYAAHEMQCKLIQVHPESSAPASSTWTLAFSCSGEGEQWTVTEHWSLQRSTTTIRGWRLTKRQLTKDSADFTPCPLEVAPAP
ncbi:hypothetical protein [Xanthobacter variabilis]|uniref:hypothetical protein n=1 Tax=Xanthobacter variabilis TaxID=3119932 RepID=UPI0037292323